jgi:hypothetical protein
MDGLVTVEYILRRFMEAAHLNTLTEVAAVIGVSSNSISGWKARDSIGILFENIYPYLLQNDISVYYVMFGIGRKDIKISELLNGEGIEGRLKRLEEMIKELSKR